jgi:fatty-acyl-CoA synthase
MTGAYRGFGADALARYAQAAPDRVAIRPAPSPDHQIPYTWWQLDREARSIAAMIAIMRDAERGGRIGWLGPNDARMLALLFACAQIGVALVPLNWRLSAEELAWIVADAELKAIFGPFGMDEAEGRFDHPLLRLSETRPGGPIFVDPKGYALAEVEAAGWAERDAFAAPRPDAPLLIAYTSGTTGRPKGAVLTQAAVAANARHAQALFGMTPDDTVLTVLPMFHVGGLCIQTLPALLAGAAIVLPTRFDADGVFDAVARHRPTLSLLVPAVMQALVRHPRWPTADLSSLRAIGAGSSEVPLHLIEAFHAKGVPVQQVYGATETGPIAIAQTAEEAWIAPGSIGRPVPGVEARLTPVTHEIEIRGPNVMAGYWRQPEATAAVLRDGWFATGDVGRLDPEGCFWFTDRLKHVIISGGENIYPAEVERVLASAPGIVEGAVVGRPDPRWGEVPVAVVVPGGDFEPAAVLAHFEGRLARFKHPREVVAIEALPRTALGKIAIATLRAMVRP